MKYKKLRIIIASLIIAFLCLGCLGTFSYAEDADSDQAFEVLDNPTDYISDDEKQQVLEDGTGLPASFDLRNVDTDGDGIGDRCYVTPVRSQYPFGTCWGFASMSAAETSILSRVLNNDPDAWKTLNLSEKQLIFFANVFLDDPDSSQYGEGRYGVNEEDKPSSIQKSVRKSNEQEKIMATPASIAAEDDIPDFSLDDILKERDEAYANAMSASNEETAPLFPDLNLWDEEPESADDATIVIEKPVK